MPSMVCREILLNDALEVSHARARRYRRDASSSMVIAEPVVAFGSYNSSLAHVVKVQGNASSLTVVVTLVNPIVVSGYPLSNLSIMRDVALNDDLQDRVPIEDAVHDYMFDTTLLDKSEDHHLSVLVMLVRCRLWPHVDGRIAL
ncbi:hypothetical protein Tco_1462363, partial [Tanacetum coccineum]